MPYAQLSAGGSYRVHQGTGTVPVENLPKDESCFFFSWVLSIASSSLMPESEKIDSKLKPILPKNVFQGCVDLPGRRKFVTHFDTVANKGRSVSIQFFRLK